MLNVSLSDAVSSPYTYSINCHNFVWSGRFSQIRSHTCILVHVHVLTGNLWFDPPTHHLITVYVVLKPQSPRIAYTQS